MNPVISTKNGKLTGNVYSWLETSGFRAQQGSTRTFSGVGLQLGADVALSPQWVAGLSVGRSDLKASTPLAETDGTYTFVQPYLAYERGDWSSELAFSLGAADYTQVSSGGTGTADSDVWSLNLSVAKDFEIDPMTTVSPMFSQLLGEERITGISGTLAGAGTETVKFAQTSLGARFNRQFQKGSAYLGLHADNVDSNAPATIAGDGFAPEGLSGRMEMGAGIAFGANGFVDIGVEAGGLGSDLNSYAGRLRVSYTF